MKITNLRPKQFGYIQLTADNKTIQLGKSGDSDWVEVDADLFDFDVVQPEYQVGDLVKIKKDGQTYLRKGFVVRKSGEKQAKYEVAIENQIELWTFQSFGTYIADIHDDDYEIVGLWDEEKNNERATTKREK